MRHSSKLHAVPHLRVVGADGLGRQLRAADVSFAELEDEGLSATDRKAAGCSLADLKANVSLADLKAAGFITTDPKAADLSLADLKAAGFSLAD